MSGDKEEETKLLPHHEQRPLCTTRLSYRQGRKLTAVKVYSVNNESNHLLLFGVPSLGLRRETKDLVSRFGKLLQFCITTDHPAEEFTETYHACFERIQSARVAKKMLDTKNFYGGSLHVCYAPELETIQETKTKLLQRKNDIQFRLRKLQKETLNPSNVVNSNIYVNNVVEHNSNVNSEIEYNYNINNEVEHSYDVNNDVYNSNRKDSPDRQITEIVNEVPNYNIDGREKVNMGENNVIYVHKGKRKFNKKYKTGKRSKTIDRKDNEEAKDIVDCTSVDKNVVSNINEALNYNTFGNEVIKTVENKPMNKIVFNLNKKT